MYKLVPKRIIKRLADTEEAEELRMTKLTLELAKESSCGGHCSCCIWMI